jgi:hypothetical protein
MIGFLCVDFDDIKLKGDHIDVIKIRTKQNLLDEMPALYSELIWRILFLVLALAPPVADGCLVTTQ